VLAYAAGTFDEPLVSCPWSHDGSSVPRQGWPPPGRQQSPLGMGWLRLGWMLKTS